MNKSLSNKKIISFIWKAVQPYKVAIFIMLFVGVVWAVDLSVRPYILKIIIDRISDENITNVFEHVWEPVVLYFFMGFLLSTVYRLYGYFVGIKMVPFSGRDIINAAFSSLLTQSYSFYQNNFAGSLANKINDLKNSVPEIFEIVFNRFFSHFLALLIAIFTLAQINYVFAIFMSIWAIGFTVGSFCLFKKIANLSDINSENNSIITGKLVDSLSNIISINLFARKKYEQKILSQELNKVVESEQKLGWMYFWIWFFYGYSWVLLHGINLYFLIKGRQEGWVSVGDFVLVLSINFAIGDFLWQLTIDFSNFSKLWGKITQALKSIQVIPEIEDKFQARKLKVVEGKIIFDHVMFHYKGNRPLFENKSIVIPGGQKVGLVGYSGSGKSTFVNLILRLYDLNAGKILIDNQDISLITQDSLHEAISMIPQEPSLFHRSLIDNIRYGRIDASDEEVIEASKKAHSNDFIMSIPEGYSAMAGEKGVKLSGGQRQRISIARAILKNSPILILDEATSQLDSLTETDIQESLWQLMQGKTTLIIAHRLSTLLGMDRILVFEEGRIVEDGSHQELLERKGQYKKLWDAQIGGFLPDKKSDI